MLPLELRVRIAECCPAAWHGLCCVDKEMWLYYKEYPRARGELVKKFTKIMIVKFPDHMERFGLLPCGWLHGFVYQGFCWSKQWNTLCLFKYNKMVRGYISFDAGSVVAFEGDMLHGYVNILCDIFRATTSIKLKYKNDKLIWFTKSMHYSTETKHTTLEDLTRKEKYCLDRVIDEWEARYKFLAK